MKLKEDFHMEDLSLYKKMYLHLFNHVTDAIRLLENSQFDKAATLLKRAQCECEDLYIEGGE